MAKLKIVYVTASKFKIEENKIFMENETLRDGTAAKDSFEIEFRPVPVSETLEVNIETMVRAEAYEAYSQVRVPCIVEHAGLIFDEYEGDWYPGGLTKPMWKALKDRFIRETASNGRKALARAVIGYCDGMSVKTFTGETTGYIADAPRGNRDFYWDTVFIPDDPTGKVIGKTYAEINDDPKLGLRYKVENLSQSSKAFRLLFEHLKATPRVSLWRT